MRRDVWAIPIALACFLLLAHRHGAAQASRAHERLFLVPHLGDAVVLDGPWLLHPGDHPSYSSPALDDSRWLPIELNGG